LRDAGMEVIYLGPGQLPDQIVKAAIDEDVDVIGISSMEGMHAVRIPEVLRLLRKEGADDISVVVGGIIPAQDVPKLKRAGVKEIFGPGTATKTIVEYIERTVLRR